MALLGDERREAQNLAMEGAQQETEMNVENENLGTRRFHQEVDKTHQEMEKEIRMGMEDEDSDGWKEREEAEMGDEGESGAGDVSVEEINDRVGGFNEDMPPVGDVCPICFDRFTIPCRSNCGHWFCATCILQVWMFSSSIQPCKCPLCSYRIVNLKPHTSNLVPQADDSVEVLNKVHQYNGLYVTGGFSAFHIWQRIKAFPLLMGRIFRVLIDPDGLRCFYYVMRFAGLLLALLYEKGEFDFIPTGGLRIQRVINLGASVFVAVLCLIGMVYRWVLRRRVRRLAAIQTGDN